MACVPFALPLRKAQATRTNRHGAHLTGGPVEATCLTPVRGSFHHPGQTDSLGVKAYDLYNPRDPNDEVALSEVLPVLCASQEGFTQPCPVCVYQCPAGHSAYQMTRNTRHRSWGSKERAGAPPGGARK